MMKIRHFLTGLFLTIPFSLSSQTEGDTLFVKSLLLSDRTEETSVAFSPDGKDLYFSRKDAIFNFGKDNNHDIWRTSRASTEVTWSAPVNAGPLLNTAHAEKVVSINATADRLYFSRLLKDREVLFAADKEGRRWGKGEAVLLPGLDIFSAIKSYFVSADEQVLLACATTAGQEQAAIYYSLKDAQDQWTTPALLRLPAHAGGDKLTAFLTADNRGLFFADNGQNTSGHYDLFYSRRSGPSWQNWSPIQPLGPEINTTANEYGLTMPLSGEIIAYISDARSGQAKVIYARLPVDFLPEFNKE